MTKHTPGPWTLSHISGSNFAVQEFGLRGMFGDKPNIYPIFNRNSAAIDGATVFCSPENARLIAAAPDMLAALKSIIAQIHDYELINNLASNPGRKECWDCVEQGIAAIAKAEP